MEKYIMEQFLDSAKFREKLSNHEFLPKVFQPTSQTTKQIAVKGLFKATGWLSLVLVKSVVLA